MLPILLLAVVGCERLPEDRNASASRPIARVGATTLSEAEFTHLLPSDPDHSLTAEEQRAYLDRWVETQLLHDALLGSGESVPDDLEFQLRDYRRELLADLYVQRVMAEHAVVSEGEVRAFYEAHAHEYLKEYRVSHILVNTREDAEKVQAQLGKRSFEYLARRNSIDKHARYAGDLGYMSKGNMIPEFDAVVFDMKVGDISDIVESEFGYHIIKVADIRDARFKLSYDDVRAEIANMLMLERRGTVYDSLISALRQETAVEIMDNALRWVDDEPADTLSHNP